MCEVTHSMRVPKVRHYGWPPNPREGFIMQSHGSINTGPCCLTVCFLHPLSPWRITRYVPGLILISLHKTPCQRCIPVLHNRSSQHTQRQANGPSTIKVQPTIRGVNRWLRLTPPPSHNLSTNIKECIMEIIRFKIKVHPWGNSSYAPASNAISKFANLSQQPISHILKLG